MARNVLLVEGLRKVGDPNALAKKYYNNNIDEIIFMDSVAAYYDRNSLTKIIEKACDDVFVPITVGGGIRKIKDIDLAIKKFVNSKYTSLRSVHEMSETSYKTMEINNKGFLKSLKNLNFSIDELNEPRQKFNKTYVPNGVIDIYNKNFVIKNKILFGHNVKAFKTSYAPEIDNKEDFNYIEYLCKKKL